MTKLLTALRAAAQMTRLRILSVLSNSKLTVSELMQILEQSQSRVSRHLKLLCDSGLLQRHQEGHGYSIVLRRDGRGRQNDINKLDFEDNSVDVITIHQVLHYLEQPERVIKEATRVLPE